MPPSSESAIACQERGRETDQNHEQGESDGPEARDRCSGRNRLDADPGCVGCEREHSRVQEVGFGLDLSALEDMRLRDEVDLDGEGLAEFQIEDVGEGEPRPGPRPRRRRAR